MKLTQSWAKKRMDRHPISRRRLAPMVEAVESRLLMTGGSSAAGFLTGAVRLDGATGAPLPGVTVEVFKAGSATPLATQPTDANGQYLFTGLQPGNYTLKEIPPTGYQAGGTNVVSQLNPASSAGLDAINVSVVDPSKVFVNYGGIDPASYGVVNDAVKGVAGVNSVGPMRDTLGSAPGKTDLSALFQTFCVNDQENLTFTGGEQYQVVPRPISQLNDGSSTISADASGRIAFLFNHYGNSSLTNVQGAGLQLAIWELLYDGGANPDLASGAFKVTGPYTPGDPNFAAEIQQAKAYVTESAGKSETGVFLDAAAASPCNPDGRQSVLASENLGFTVHKADVLTPLARGETATIGFWNNKNGQALIRSFNGGPSSPALAKWLATSFPNLFGPGSGGGSNPNDLTGKTNSDVAALFRKDFGVHGMKVDAQLLAVALADYATTASLGGADAAPYGFTVTGPGVGSAGINVGGGGAAFGVPDGTVLSVFQILTYADGRSKNGLLYNGNATLLGEANVVFDGINQGGDIS